MLRAFSYLVTILVHVIIPVCLIVSIIVIIMPVRSRFLLYLLRSIHCASSFVLFVEPHGQLWSAIMQSLAPSPMAMVR